MIYAIADLHLGTAVDKPMDIFGPEWENHAGRIADNWDREVRDSDVVLVAGDISWAMRLPDALPDLEYIAKRPGRKILIRGNHDYWWKRENTRRIQQMIDPSITLLQGQPLILDGVGVTGTRGWRLDEEGNTSETNLKIFQRELAYLRAGLEGLPADLDQRIVMLHYPPFTEDLKPNEFFELLVEHSVNTLVYGHIHQGSGGAVEGDVHGVSCHLVAVDNLGFAPIKVGTSGGRRDQCPHG